MTTRTGLWSRALSERRIEHVEASIAFCLSALDTADRQESGLALEKAGRLKSKIAALREQMQRFRELEPQVPAAPDQQISLADPDARAMAARSIGTDVVGCLCSAQERLSFQYVTS